MWILTGLSSNCSLQLFYILFRSSSIPETHLLVLTSRYWNAGVKQLLKVMMEVIPNDPFGISQVNIWDIFFPRPNSEAAQHPPVSNLPEWHCDGSTITPINQHEQSTVPPINRIGQSPAPSLAVDWWGNQGENLDSRKSWDWQAYGLTEPSAAGLWIATAIAEMWPR